MSMRMLTRYIKRVLYLNITFKKDLDFKVVFLKLESNIANFL